MQLVCGGGMTALRTDKHLNEVGTARQSGIIYRLPGQKMSTSSIEPCRLTAVEVVSHIRAGKLTVLEYAKSLLLRIKERDPIVKAWAYIDPDYVLDQAKRLDGVDPQERGPLHGVAVAVKDIIYTKGTGKLRIS